MDLGGHARNAEGAGLGLFGGVQCNPKVTEQTGVFAALSGRTTRGRGGRVAVAPPPPEVVEDPGDELLDLTVALSRLATRASEFQTAILKKNGIGIIRKSLVSGGASNKSRLAMLRTLALLCLKDDGRAEVYADKELLHLIEDIEVCCQTCPKPKFSTLDSKLSQPLLSVLNPQLSTLNSKLQTPTLNSKLSTPTLSSQLSTLNFHNYQLSPPNS
jgi:hypothetical protein